MTTLGDVFGKLSGVRLLSILKWYGRIVVWTALAAMALFILTGLVLLVIEIVTSIPWWVTVGFLVLVSAWVALKIADPDCFKSDLDREIDGLENGNFYASKKYRDIVAKESAVIDNWEEIRSLVACLDENAGLSITLKDEKFDFETRQEALDFLNGKKSQ